MKNSSLAFGSALAVVSLLGTFTLAHAQDPPMPERPIAGTGDGFIGLRPNYPNGQRGFIWYGDEESRRRDQSGESLMFSARRQTGGPRPVEPDGQMYAVWAKDANGSEQYVGTFSDRAQALKAFDQANLDIDKRAFVTPITKGDEYYERLKHSWVEVPAYNKPNTTVAASAPRPVVRPVAATGFVYDSNVKKPVSSLEGTKWKTPQGGTVEFSSETMTAEMRRPYGPEFSDRAAENAKLLDLREMHVTHPNFAGYRWLGLWDQQGDKVYRYETLRANTLDLTGVGTISDGKMVFPPHRYDDRSVSETETWDQVK